MNKQPKIYFDDANIKIEKDYYTFTSVLRQDHNNKDSLSSSLQLALSDNKNQFKNIKKFIKDMQKSMKNISEQVKAQINYAILEQFIAFMQFLDEVFKLEDIWYYVLRCTEQGLVFEAIFTLDKQLEIRIKIDALTSQNQKSSLPKQNYTSSIQKPLPKDVDAPSFVFQSFFTENFKLTFVRILKGSQQYQQGNLQDPSSDSKNQTSIQQANYYYIFKQTDKIGKGQHGNVYKGVRIDIKISRLDKNNKRLRINRLECAIKHFKQPQYQDKGKNKPISTKWKDAGKNEYKVTKQLNQTCEQKAIPEGRLIIKVLDKVSFIKQWYNIYELCLCDLSDFRKDLKYPRLTFNHIFSIMLQLVQVLNLIQSTLSSNSKQPKKQQKIKCLVHRDLKPKNILVSQYSQQDVQIKVTDWELAQKVQKGGKNTLQSQGTHNAPEVIDKNSCDQTIDNWALGATFYELITSKYFDIKNNYEKELSQNEFVNPHLLTEGQMKICKTLLLGLLQKQSARRWSVQTVKTHLQKYKPIQAINFVLLDDSLIYCLHYSSLKKKAKIRQMILKGEQRSCIQCAGQFLQSMLKFQNIYQVITRVDSIYDTRWQNLQIFEEYNKQFKIEWCQLKKQIQKIQNKDINPLPRYIIEYLKELKKN